MNPSDAAWAARLSAVVPTDFSSGSGLVKAYVQNADEWGYNLSESETEVDYDGNEGGTAMSRTFSKVGLVVWDNAQGAVVVGWPPLAEG